MPIHRALLPMDMPLVLYILLAPQILAIQGYVGVFTMSIPAPPTDGAPIIATLALISRLGWKRAGTRFNTRGVDDDGNCANFVEASIISFSTALLHVNCVNGDASSDGDDLHHRSALHQLRPSTWKCSMYVSLRCLHCMTKPRKISHVVFWEQQGLQTFGQRIQITRPQASQPAFERHFAQLTEEYGAVHVINLLGTKENEAILTSAYARHLQIARGAFGDELGITNFDFHNAVRVGGHDSVFENLRYLLAWSRVLGNLAF
jgi:synaptojanin